MTRYLALRHIGAGDAEALATLSADMGITDAETRTILEDEAKNMREAGQSGLEPSMSLWTSTSANRAPSGRSADRATSWLFRLRKSATRV